MKNTHLKRKGIIYVLFVSLLMVVLSAAAVSVFGAEGATDGWTFSKASVSDPVYVSEHFDALPRAYEAEVNFASGSYSNASPIISNYRNNDAKDCFGFEIHKSGNPAMYFYQTEYEPSNNKVWRIKTYIRFTDYSVIGKGWVRISVANEIDESTGKSIYKLYVNGEHVQTISNYTVEVYEGTDKRDGYSNYLHDIDPIDSQSTNRELSIGNDGINYFKGQLRNVAVYENALTAEEAKNTAKTNMNAGDSNLMAYYDSTMSGNSDGFIKDQTGNGHDAYKFFFTRKEALKDYAYSFAFVGDTQFLMYRDASLNTTSYTKPIYDWIVQNKDEKNIEFVFGLGDITDRNEYIEWEKALYYHDMLEDAEIPYAIVPGNHDDYTNHVKYNAYFGEIDYFTDRITGYYKDGRVENYYMNFDVGEHKYMVIGLQYGAPDEILAWANKVVAENSDRKVIVITHSLFGYDGNWSEADTREQASTSVKTLNNGIDMWNEFISLHENIIICAAGHIDPMDIKHRTDVGVNGNTVNSFLIDPQGLDKATDFKTGMVAMFYFSEDGSDVQVEYVSATKTLEAQKTNPDADDILYNEKNQFSFSIDATETVSEYTEYGTLPVSCVAEGNKFAIFSKGEFLGGYKTWNSATTAVATLFAENNNADIQLVMLADYENADDNLKINAFNYANGKLTIDLRGYTFSVVGTFLNFNNYDGVSNTAAANITVKNGTIRSKSRPVITNQITNVAYAAEKTWNLTFENVTMGYAEGCSGYGNGTFYQAWTNNATSDEGQLGAITNIVFNNCTFDLKTNAPEGAVKLFALQDNRSLDKIDVSVKVNGGKVLADIADLANVTFYTLNSGSDSILFGAYNGEYTKLITHTTERNYSHYSGTLPALDGNRYFIEIADDGVTSTYELQSLTVVGEDVTGTITLGSNIKYLSAIDYPFAVFDQTGKFYGAYDYLLGKQNGAIDRAIYGVLRDKNDFNVETGKYNSDANTAYILMRASYTMRTYMDGTTAKQEYHNNISHAQGNLVIDMCGHTIVADKTRTSYIFDATIKRWSGSEDGVAAFPSYYTVKNGAFEVYNVSVLRLYASNKDSDISEKVMSWTFDNVKFGLCEGATENYFFHISNSAGGTTIAPVELILNDCVFDFETNVPTKDFTVFCSNFTKTTHMKAKVEINGGKILAKNLDLLKFTNFSDVNGSTMTFGKGSDGKYLSVILPRTASFGKFESIKVKTANGTELIMARATEAAKSTYTLCIKTAYGNVSAEYEDATKYPFFVFKSDGTFVGAYSDWAIDAKPSALNNSKSAGSVILLRRDYTYSTSSQYNNLSQTNDLLVDLNGFSMTSTNVTFFMAQKKTEYDTKIKVINGTMIIGGQRPLVRMDTSASFSGKYGFTFTFENVNFEITDSTPKTDILICYSSFVDGDPSQYCNFTFTDCTFDLSNATKAFSIFDVSDSRSNVKVVINGGEIITSAYAVTVWKDFATTPGTVTASAKSSLTFAKGTDGYTKLTVPTGTSLPITTVNGGALAYVKTAAAEGKEVYELISEEFNKYVPKMSITLSNNLIMNVYVPKDMTDSFILNDVAYDVSVASDIVTLSDGKDYYLVSIPLASSDAAMDIKLTATVSTDTDSANVTFTFSIPKYAIKVLSDLDATDVEKTLAKDVLAYVKAAYNYFTAFNTAEEIARVNALIDSIIGDYTSAPESSGVTNTVSPVTGVTLNLDAEPSIRFYVTDTTLSFMANGKKLKTVIGSDENGAYLELDVYAYALCETITYGDGGSYHISNFLENAAGTDYEVLVKTFVKYTESAAAYRNAVIGA